MDATIVVGFNPERDVKFCQVVRKVAGEFKSAHYVGKHIDSESNTREIVIHFDDTEEFYEFRERLDYSLHDIYQVHSTRT